MKVSYISDLHLDHRKNKPWLEQSFIPYINETKPEVLVIAGDIANRIDDYEDSLNKFMLINKEVKILLVHGNHDVWLDGWADKNKFKSCEEKISALEELVDEREMILLGGKRDAYVKDGVHFIGNPGWYDYTSGLRNDKYTHEFYVGQRFWIDKHKCNWEMSPDADDKIVHDYYLSRMEESLKQVPANDKVVAITHMIPYMSGIKQGQSEDWNVCNSFFGCPKFGELYKKYPQVKHAISGHTHFPHESIEDGVRFLVNPLGYPYEELNPSPLKTIEI